MISEPELEGEETAVPAPRTSGGGGTVPAAGFGRPDPGPGPGSGAGTGPDFEDGTYETIDAEDPPGAPPRRRPWVWALGGAVVASAVWAGGLYAYHRPGPDLRGYGISRNLCLAAELPALTDRIGRRTENMAGADETLAVDRAVCRVTLMPGRPDKADEGTPPTTYANVRIDYIRHKETDPAPEFEATLADLTPSGDGKPTVEGVTDLGDHAYLVSETPGFNMRLSVLDGQAEFAIDVSLGTFSTVNPVTGTTDDSDPSETINISDIEGELISDMTDLMAALKE
ncbi:hypothetical protein [Streptomyces paludis]|uniref:Uncharacterized protein n=1 Tax=Streptomyces paludis TaxID=2282738 RepID=A0A345HTK9_9ACTN|nr:hypothetical protein [Streptomyces paludis]AXG80033.1 hypothetical protein DVK44_22920 [Streptomyces paludis]